MRNRRDVACQIAEAHAADAELVVRIVALADGVIMLLRGQEEIAFRVHAECQEECEETAIGRSRDGSIWCVVCPEPSAFQTVQCRLAEELHLYEGLDSPLAAEAGIRVVDASREGTTLAAFSQRSDTGGGVVSP
jgi:hypothetical protein